MTDNWKEITDPEELFRLKREGWEIEWSAQGVSWSAWPGILWNKGYLFRARPRQPKMKKMKLMAWLDPRAELRWMGDAPTFVGWTRVTSEDKEIEVPDDN